MSPSAKSQSNSNSGNFMSFCFVFDKNEEDIKDFEVSRSEMYNNMNLDVIDIPLSKFLFRNAKFAQKL